MRLWTWIRNTLLIAAAAFSFSCMCGSPEGVYERCDSDSDCPEGLNCLRYVPINNPGGPINLCSTTCSDRSECPEVRDCETGEPREQCRDEVCGVDLTG